MGEGWILDDNGGGSTAFHGLNTGFCREKRLLVYILCCTHELTLLAASAFAAFEGCLLSLQQIEYGKVLKTRYTLKVSYNGKQESDKHIKIQFIK